VTDPIATLIGLGFNKLEAEIYCHLLQNDAATPYRIARALGRQTANVYKAVETLARRGAVLVEEGDSRFCRAVPAREFIGHIKRDFLSRTTQAAALLSDLDRPTYDERVYRIESVPEVLERAASMLAIEAETVAVVDAFPRSWQAIRPAVEKAINRGVQVHLQTYEPVDIKGAIAVVAVPGRAALEHWGSEQLNVVIDGRQHLLALLSVELDCVYQALWSNSLYLSALMHAGLTSEQTIHRALQVVGRKGSLAALVRGLRAHRFFIDNQLPGQQELLARFPRDKS
jgi:sugar-specific transcriptional regulator TrmB